MYAITCEFLKSFVFFTVETFNEVPFLGIKGYELNDKIISVNFPNI